MTTNNAYQNISKALRNCVAYTDSITPFLLAFIICLSLGVYSSPQAYFQAAPIYQKQRQSQTKANSYFKLKPFTTLQVKSKIVFKTNLNLYSNITGIGNLILSSEKAIELSSNNQKINTLIIKSQTKVKLKGHLHIERGLRIQDKGEIALGNFNLILSPQLMLFDNAQKRILKTGIGSLIHSSTNKNKFATNSQNNHQTQQLTANTQGFLLKKHIESLLSNDRYSKRSLSPAFAKLDTPPPRQSVY